MKGIPLAWLQLMHERRRLAAAIAGIVFAVLLMLVQLGFEQALFKSVTLFYEHFNADLVLVNPLFQSMNARWSFSRQRVLQARGFAGVAWARPMYIGPGKWRNPVTGAGRGLVLIGIEPLPGVFDIPSVNLQVAKLLRPGTALFDTHSRPEFGPMEELLRTRHTVTTQLNESQIDVVGGFILGTSFVADANVLVSDSEFLRLSPPRQAGLCEFGLIKLNPGADPLTIQKRIHASLPPDVRVVTKAELIQMEKDYWAGTTPIGFVFRLGLGMGIFVGLIVVYQILYSDVTDHLSEYATLKAMGYSDSALAWVVLQEALILSALGFIPGLLASAAVFWFARQATLLPLEVSLSRSVVVYLLTVFMCSASGLFAVRRLRMADPADIF